ncbi:MAG: alpha-galactosidase [Clostridiales bacterium]|nr:alpha-galactosidase [Clostridiales bacterium]
MAILVNEEKKLFTLNTKSTTYQMKVIDYGYLAHLYYGKRLDGDMSYVITHYDRGFSGNPNDAGEDRTFSMDNIPQEYSCYGNGDYRTPAFNMKDIEGVHGADLRYVSYEVLNEKYSLKGLPAAYTEGEKGETLKIVLMDDVNGVQVTLLYGVIEDKDVITRAAIVKNVSDADVFITKAASTSLDFVSGDYDIIHFHGRHAMERMFEREEITHGVKKIGSIRGTSSHQHSPFVMLADRAANEDHGDCYGISLLYSGSFNCEVEKDQTDQIRLNMGIQDEMFEYVLYPGSEFVTPEVAMVYSADGFADMTHKMHDLVRYNICRGEYKTKRRPVLINSWEAVYFDFDGDDIVNIAKKASELGVEMLVLDDGWFGVRNDDRSGLGDWFVNEDKMGGSMADVVKRVNDLGMKFGIWIEPEMISEKSRLFEEHPDFAFRIPGRKPVMSRSQLNLDFSRKEVVDCILEQMFKVFDQINVEYIKMDMNRSIANVYSITEGIQNNGTILYKYVLGVYDFMDRLQARYPKLFIEGCSGGGGRFDAGMMYYTPQIWCSDNTDAICRLDIQYGTSFGYPISVVGSHVSAVPNHQTGRITPFNTRAVVAMAGSFGYELDLNKVSDEEKEEVKTQIAAYKKYWDLMHNGLYYRLTDADKSKKIAAWSFVSRDKAETLVNIVTVDSFCNSPVPFVRVKGLDADATYVDEATGAEYSGQGLDQIGLPVPLKFGEYNAYQIHLVRK